MKPPIDYSFPLNGHTYRLVEWDSGGERRIQREYALGIAPAPDTLAQLDGANLYALAVLRECLRDAPKGFDLDHVPRDEWGQLVSEVNTFLGKLFRDVQPEPESPPAPVPERPVAVAAPQALSTAFAGRAG
jgi:hypothetical protein